MQDVARRVGCALRSVVVLMAAISTPPAKLSPPTRVNDSGRRTLASSTPRYTVPGLVTVASLAMPEYKSATEVAHESRLCSR